MSSWGSVANLLSIFHGYFYLENLLSVTIHYLIVIPEHYVVGSSFLD